MNVRRIYVHYPFCSSYCRYCNFSAGAPPKEEYTTPYFEALLKEAALYHSFLDQTLSSLYLGGGTPSLMPPAHLEKLMSPYASCLGGTAEITLEINPETVTRERARFWKSLGINRASLGWQSMEDKTLQMLNRSGTSEDNRRAFTLLKEEGFSNISVDRILSVQGDQDDSFYKALEELKPNHVSVYQLSIEERTVLHAWAKEGRYSPLNDEEALSKEEACNFVLQTLGYERYEISNYAKDGAIGQHNTAYWDYDYYLGLGAGAAGFLPQGNWGIRTLNPFSFKDYLKGIPAETEVLDKATAVKEALMLGVRKRAGIGKAAFEKRLSILWGDLFSSPPDPGFFEDLPDTLRLKEEAIPLCNPAILSLWDKLSENILSQNSKR